MDATPGPASSDRPAKTVGGRGQDVPGLLVLRGQAVISDVAGDQDRIQRHCQAVQIGQDGGGPIGPVPAAVQVGIAEVRDNDHPGAPLAGGKGGERAGPGIAAAC